LVIFRISLNSHFKKRKRKEIKKMEGRKKERKNERKKLVQSESIEV